jgi:hypothetical protein
MKSIGSDLDASADFDEFCGTLEHDRSHAFARQPERRGESADASASDDHR